MKLSKFHKKQMLRLADGTIRGLEKFRKKLKDWAEDFLSVYKDSDKIDKEVFSKDPIDYEKAFFELKALMKTPLDDKEKIVVRHFINSYVEIAKGYVQHAATLAIVYGSKQTYPVLELTGATMNELLEMTPPGWAEELLERMKKEEFNYTKEEARQIKQVCDQLKKRVGPRLVWA